jgi:hypothetical protein
MIVFSIELTVSTRAPSAGCLLDAIKALGSRNASCNQSEALGCLGSKLYFCSALTP